MEKVCKADKNKHGQTAQTVQQHHQTMEQLFVASCYTIRKSEEVWLINTGCTNHMSHKAS